MKRALFCCSFLLALPGCEVWEALVSGLAQLKTQPQFVFARVEPVVGGGPSDRTPEITLGTVTAPGTAFVFERVRPFPDRTSELRQLLWDGTGTRLAAQMYEPFFGGFDDWIFVYDRDLNPEFSGSDDTVGSAMAAICAPMDAPDLQSAADLLISEGAIPVGSIARFQPGTGIIQGASFQGWLSPTRFVMTLFHEPNAFAVAPDGTVHDLSAIVGSPTLGEFISPATTFVLGGGNWMVENCAANVPAIPARPIATPLLTLDTGGAVLADGAALTDQTGVVLEAAVAVDGSY